MKITDENIKYLETRGFDQPRIRRRLMRHHSRQRTREDSSKLCEILSVLFGRIETVRPTCETEAQYRERPTAVTLLKRPPRHELDHRNTLAPLLLRSLIGGTMIAHGLKHGRSIEGTADWFESIGFRRPKLQAQTSALVEVGAGVALAAGAATPVAAAAVVGTMAVAARSVHVSNGFFITSEGWEYVTNLAAAAAVLAAIGPGRWSVDHAFKWGQKLRGDRGLALAAGLGLVGAAAQLATFYRRPAGSDGSDRRES